MRTLLKKALYTFILIIVFTYTDESLSMAVQPPRLQDNFRIIKAQTELTHGGIGFITIQGQPGTRYTTKSLFKTNNKTYYVTQWRIADINGIATFIWVAGNETESGSYPVTISGGGKSISTNYTVLP